MCPQCFQKSRKALLVGPVDPRVCRIIKIIPTVCPPLAIPVSLSSLYTSRSVFLITFFREGNRLISHLPKDPSLGDQALSCIPCAPLRRPSIMPWVNLCPCHGMAAGTSAPLHPGYEGDLGRFQAPDRNPPLSAPPAFSFFFLLFLCSAGPCYLPLTLTPSSSCLKFRL